METTWATGQYVFRTIRPCSQWNVCRISDQRCRATSSAVQGATLVVSKYYCYQLQHAAEGEVGRNSFNRLISRWKGMPSGAGMVLSESFNSESAI